MTREPTSAIVSTEVILTTGTTKSATRYILIRVSWYACEIHCPVVDVVIQRRNIVTENGVGYEFDVSCELWWYIWSDLRKYKTITLHLELLSLVCDILDTRSCWVEGYRSEMYCIDRTT